MHFLDLRDRLQFFLVIAGTGISAATLGSGALRNTLIAWAKSDTLSLACIKVAKSVNFPAEMVLLYGLYTTALLTLVYIPTFIAFQSKGREICGSTYPKPSFNSDASDSWVNWYSNQKKVEELLKLQLGATDSLKTGISILAPLAGSAISLLLGSK